ncbi:MAG: hypothetical protein KJO40_07620 [Deltaproteobacteria bacterium]|nr:hypothetical protein [Deltaproteobacteria bacterium]NND29751.1 hypothetical protein [Myxococcales bacterium]MBT8465575.1 hypothetical protein [Deltaproteobacteria bacterium]MBT8480165.1 hypothetical protein [Deltaproteobacteria bacterium]NNK09589.1 hypothetical protein [Myxococcales bacterium]
MNASFPCAGVTRGPLLIMLAALIGCGDDAIPPPGTDLPYELYCDIANGNCQRTIYNSVAAKLEATEFAPPRIRTISVQQHADEIRRSVDLQDLTGEDATSRGLRLLGFLPEASESVTASQTEFRINQIAAYYSPGDDMITVVDRDYEEVSAQALLAHEFTHAIQERQFGFAGVWADVDSEDKVLGARSVIEGDASHTEYAWAYEQLGYLPEEIDWEALYADNEAWIEGRVDDREAALLDTASIFPYVHGLAFMSRATLDLGLQARGLAFGAPPSSAFEVMRGVFNAPATFDFPGIAHPAPVEGHTREVEDRMGAWYVYAFLRRNGVAAQDAWTSALSWRGDELAIYDTGTEIAAVWRVRFDESASTVGDAINAETEGRVQTAVVFGQDVFVLAAESEPALLAWAERPLDTMAAAVVLKDGRRQGGLSAGTCMRSLDFHLPIPPPLLQ